MQNFLVETDLRLGNASFRMSAYRQRTATSFLGLYPATGVNPVVFLQERPRDSTANEDENYGWQAAGIRAGPLFRNLPVFTRGTTDIQALKCLGGNGARVLLPFRLSATVLPHALKI